MQRAKRSFYASIEGDPERFVREGDLVADNDSILDGRADLFEDVELSASAVRHTSPVQKAPKDEPEVIDRRDEESPLGDEPPADDAAPTPTKKAAPAKKSAAKPVKKAPAKKAAPKKAPAKKA